MAATEPLRIMVYLKRDTSEADRAAFWKHLNTAPSPGIQCVSEFEYALTYERGDDAKTWLDYWEAYPGVERASVLPQLQF